jgi:hypothetical protein
MTDPPEDIDPRKRAWTLFNKEYYGKASENRNDFNVQE